MRAHYLQHVPFEGLGSIAPWLQAAGFRISCSRLFASEPLPDHHTVDMLVVMGGPMSANDDDGYIRCETDWIRIPLVANAPFLGLCLGAQMLARHLGSEVRRHPENKVEIGYYPLRATVAGRRMMAWPLALSPQHQSLPSVSTAQVWRSPAATAPKLFPGIGSVTSMSLVPGGLSI